MSNFRSNYSSAYIKKTILTHVSSIVMAAVQFWEQYTIRWYRDDIILLRMLKPLSNISMVRSEDKHFAASSSFHRRESKLNWKSILIKKFYVSWDYQYVATLSINLFTKTSKNQPLPVAMELRDNMEKMPLLSSDLLSCYWKGINIILQQTFT